MFLSEPALWRELNITSERGSVDVPLLRRVGSLVASLRIDSGHEREAALDSLNVQLLESLATQGSVAQLPQLPRFSRLTRLHLWSQQDVAAGIAALLPQLPQLQSLKLSSGKTILANEDLRGILFGTQLTELDLFMDSFEQPEALRHLTRLRQLRRLFLRASNFKEPCRLDPPEPAQLPALERFAFQSSGVEVDDESGDAGVLVRRAVCFWAAFNFRNQAAVM